VSGEIVFKDNFNQAVAGIVEVFWTLPLQFLFFMFQLFCQCLFFPAASMPADYCRKFGRSSSRPVFVLF